MNVQCSWKVSDGRPISDAVFYNRESNDTDLEEEINAENCVFLKAPDKCDGLYPTVPACQLLISCEPPNQIVSISAICEARVIEIYGHHGEYIKTVFNSPLEETDNLSVYRGDVMLEKPLSVCSVKFVNLETPNEMWLFGVKINIEKISQSPQTHGLPFPFATIQQALQGVGDSAEDKEALKRFADNLLKIHHNGPPSLQQLPIPPFLKSASGNLPNFLLNSELDIQNSNKLQDTTFKNLNENTLQTDEAHKECAISEEQNQLKMTNLTKTVSTSPEIFLCQTTSTQTDEEYVSLEENIKNYVNEQLKGINQKFLELEAKILCKLDEIESFVKPHGVS